MTKEKCLKCGFEWPSRVDNPKQCPRCKRYDWNEETITSQSQSSNPGEAGHNNGVKETSKHSSVNKDNEQREKQDKPATPSHTSKDKEGLKI